jgi:hypothetical protein
MLPECCNVANGLYLKYIFATLQHLSNKECCRRFADKYKQFWTLATLQHLFSNF